MNMKKIGFAIAVIALAIFAAGCIDSGPHPTIVPTQEEAPNLYQDPTPTPTFRRSTQIPQPERNDDAIFLQLVAEMGLDVSGYLNDLGTNMVDKKYIDAQTSAANLESLAMVYIEDINECVVTDEMKPVRILILKCLEELRLGSIDAQAGLGTSVDIDELNKASVHFKMAVGYSEAAGEII